MKSDSLQILCFEGTPQGLATRIVSENKHQLSQLFTEVTVDSDDLPLPQESYVRDRQQHRAMPFLDILQRKVHSPIHALGLIDLDLFVPELNFIFGSAQFGGNAIVALPRLRQSFYGLRNDDDLFFERTVKEVFHELGHVKGLRHCANHCVMRFSNSLSDTDIKPSTYCPDCLRRLG